MPAFAPSALAKAGFAFGVAILAGASIITAIGSAFA